MTTTTSKNASPEIKSINHSAKSSSADLLNSPTGKIWYLLYVKAKEEGRAVMHLANQGITAFYPKANITKVLRGKRQVVEEALFPNYVFAELDHGVHNFTSVRSTRGVIGFVKSGKDYQKVPNKLISTFRELETVVSVDKKVPSKGVKVLIDTPAYNNIQAIYQEPKGENRALLLIQLLNKPVLIELENNEFTVTD
ncbi:transcription/translation regulatory transformer protein RfaH [Opacimonas viscosa]|uniref:Transcription/translation regulatory transformer protein RfaH n=1 Tax=Opacimonas viscosa TaxID=2961944 RepID=A0AA41WZ11_9ALTE|nr:transcription/translation regulatory transformer protein RfaH [Opacimonas viscosa]MCP3429102.1 transcription/translation regulatory transformer protein RfaH [Opacimonas viscosa]